MLIAQNTSQKQIQTIKTTDPDGMKLGLMSPLVTPLYNYCP